MAQVDFGGLRKEVCLEYIPDAKIGEYVIVHVGFAIQRLDEKSAQETLANFEQARHPRGGVRRRVRAAPRNRQRATFQTGGGVMKYLDEFSDPELARKLVDEIHAITTRPWAMMEVCGGQTHSIIRHGIDQLLPEGVEMIHGPGCPVCVTPLEMIDKALAIAAQPGVIFCSFGDMLRVPGSQQGSVRDQERRRRRTRRVFAARRGQARASRTPTKQVVFFGIGFETTAPANAMTVYQAKRQGITNFSLLVSHVLVPPAIAAIMESPRCRVQAFLAAGHVCSVMGTSRVPAARREVPGADRGHRFRAARHPGGHPADT